MNKVSYTGIILILLLAVSCQKEDSSYTPEPTEPYLIIPEGFPAPVFPDDNEFTDARWELGKKLFFDPIMSRTQTISCASCHLPAYAFSDTISVSFGVDELRGTRNSPSLANIAYHPYFTREGGVPSLEMQVLVPIQEHNEFDMNILDIADRLKTDPEYIKMSQDAYGREPDYFVIPRALATFERSFLSGNSSYDRYFFQSDNDALSELEKEGMELFNSERTNCSACHSGFNFTNYGFENNGIYEQYADPGRYRLTNDEKDIALFKVPGLRNIEFTAPYMHDGSFKNLEEVIEHYNTGGKSHPNKSELLKPLNLTANEKAALMAFLLSLSDIEFINNKKFKP